MWTVLLSGWYGSWAGQAACAVAWVTCVPQEVLRVNPNHSDALTIKVPASARRPHPAVSTLVRSLPPAHQTHREYSSTLASARRPHPTQPYYPHARTYRASGLSPPAPPDPHPLTLTRACTCARRELVACAARSVRIMCAALRRAQVRLDGPS